MKNIPSVNCFISIKQKIRPKGRFIMKKNRILSIIAAAAVVSSLSASVFADDYSKSKIENSIALLTQNEEVKTYYDKITADMSWLRTTTDSFAIFDVTGDNIPELIVTSTVTDKAEKGGEYDKKLHKFYSLKGDKAEYMYSASMSCPTIAPSIEGKKLKWVYDDHMLAQDDSGLTMNSEYGYMTFTDEKIIREPVFKATESVDPDTDTMEYSYKGNGDSYGARTVRNYSKKKKGADSSASSRYNTWQHAAESWEGAQCISQKLYLLEPVDDCYLLMADGSKECVSASTPIDVYGYSAENGKAPVKKTKTMFRMNVAELLNYYFNEELWAFTVEGYNVYGDGDDVPAAKPVIYLYPEKEQQVSVKMELNGRFMCTYPEYKDGWDVTAKPDGTIIADGKEYSYLFWDASLNAKWDFSTGFVVKGSDTADFLREKLSYMGLTPKEYNEFIVYWLPQMEKNPYNLISFQTEAYENAAKLHISPEPDSILRIFMAYKPLDKYTEVEEQKLDTFERKGFTVVEWGGGQC